MSNNLLTRALMLALTIGFAAPTAASALDVYAASSLREVFTRIDDSPTYNFLGSNTLQLQIERGAPADVFASASPAEAQALFRGANCLRPVTFATNKLVMLVPKGNPKGLKSVYGCAWAACAWRSATPACRSAATPARCCAGSGCRAC